MNPPYPSAPLAGSTPLGSTATPRTTLHRVRRATQLLKCDVRDAKGDKIGAIEELIVDERAGYLASAVLSFGGFLGIGEKHFAVPLSRLKRTSDSEFVVSDLSRVELEGAPSFAPGSWPQFDRKYTESVNSHYRATSPSTLNRTVGPVGSVELDPEIMHARGLERASNVIGADVADPSGAVVGTLTDLAIEDGSDRIVYAVLSFGGFLGMGDKLFALPWSSLTSTAVDGRQTLILDVAKQRLAEAPGFDKHHWPNFADRTWGTDVHRYYGRQPWWVGSEGSDPLATLPR